jgi:hypothetical protein
MFASVLKILKIEGDEGAQLKSRRQIGNPSHIYVTDKLLQLYRAPCSRYDTAITHPWAAPVYCNKCPNVVELGTAMMCF